MMDRRSYKSFIQWPNAFSRSPFFPECGQLKGVFLNTKLKLLHSCHNNSSLNKWYFKKIAWMFHVHKWIIATVKRYWKLIEWPWGQDKNLKFEIQEKSSYESLVKVVINFFFCSWKVYGLSPNAWVIGKIWTYEISDRIHYYSLCVCVCACAPACVSPLWHS